MARSSLSRGFETVVLTRSEPDAPTRAALAAAKLVVGEAGDVSLVRSAVEGATQVLYAAGGLMPAESERNPALDASLTFPPLLNLLETLRATPGTALTYISSGGTVYGQPSYLPVDEGHPTDPVSSYGMLKLTAENFAGRYAAIHGLQVRILRCANVYGEGQPADRGQGAVAAFMERLFRNQPIVLFGDGEVVRDYVHVADVADAVFSLMECPPEPQIVNVGSGRGHSLNELVSLLERVSGRRMEVERRPARSFDVSAIVLDISRLRALAGFEPTPLETGVERLLAAQAPGTVASLAPGASTTRA
ncbi:MAG: NAD-dependent epimerase/dehydratase family protein [Actinomycetota bacterium]|nr:NAD-dependent epimerase/dehydratase family protein [Actinomycetota bacterium]MDQ2980770.1 NAD-dependent epimerase/dehydratase family protein [Actinomycetota bacterium]